MLLSGARLPNGKASPSLILPRARGKKEVGAFSFSKVSYAAHSS